MDIKLKGNSKTISLPSDTILYKGNIKESTKQLLGQINKFSKVSGYKINTQKRKKKRERTHLWGGD